MPFMYGDFGDNLASCSVEEHCLKIYSEILGRKKWGKK